MKKLVLVSVCFVVLAFGLSAIELSAGLGGDVGTFFTSTSTNAPELVKSQINEILDDMDTLRWGFSAFFDAQYIEANLGFKYFLATYQESGDLYKEVDNFFTFGLKFKYPFKITEAISIFPLLGFDYSLFSRGKASYGGQSISIVRDDLPSSGDIDRFSLNLGAGGDFYVGKNVFIRGEFNYAFLFNTESQKDIISVVESLGYDLSIFQSGPVFKLAIGYRFFSN
jgi:opacity protein-like surface antigen